MHACWWDFPLPFPLTVVCVWISVCLCVCADAVLVHLPGPAGVLPVRGHRAGRVLPRGTSGQTAQHLCTA